MKETQNLQKTDSGGYQEGKPLEEFEEGLKEEEEKEEEILEEPEIGLDMILRFVGSFASKGLPPELRERFINEYVEFNKLPLTAIQWERTIGWALKWLATMPDWQRFLLGCGIMVGSGVYMRVEFARLIKEQKKQEKKNE